MSAIPIWTKPLRGGRLRVFEGGSFGGSKIFSART
jgi:hypothetical protein